MAKGGQTKDYTKFLHRFENFVPPLGEEDGTEGPMIIEAPSESKKPNGPGYRTPHWFQWRSYMTNGTNIDVGQNRGCGTFNLYMDEFRGGKITIFVQWDHRKTGEKSLPFFETLKKCTKKSDFQWAAKAEVAFKQMKKLIAELPTLTAPMEIEELIVYLAAAREATKNVSQGTNLGGFHSGTAGLILTNPEGAEFTYALRFRFDETNNEAQYEALIVSLRIAEQMGVKNLQINVDSRLVANQVPISENMKADALSKIASTSFAHLTKQVLVKELKEKSISEVKVLAVLKEEGDTWMTLIYNYLTEETLLAEKEKARAVRRKSRRYDVINRVLYKKSYLEPWLQCVGPLQANYILREIHEGSCSMHARTRSVVAKAIHERSKDWIEEISYVLLAHCATIKSRYGDTPLSFTYRTKAVITAEIGMPTLRTSEIDMVQNDEALEINLDLLEERREQTASAKQEARQRWKNITTLKSASQASNLGTLSIETMMSAMQKIARSLALSGNDRMR
nr:reverse transcriptase domain-containing protein [Tanacetum cinerariifolium]